MSLTDLDETSNRGFNAVSDNLYSLIGVLSNIELHLEKQRVQQNNNTYAICDSISELTTMVGSVVDTTEGICIRLTKIIDILDNRMVKPTTPRATKNNR